jgi:hypothetical protein
MWSKQFGTTFGSVDALTYNPTQVFQTFAFPENYETDSTLEAVGKRYRDFRAELMVARNEGMTKTYNRFHDANETSADIGRLRELHAEMDRAVLRAYGWNDLADRAQTEFLTEETEDDHTYQRRLFWPSDFRDEVLARLLTLNAERHEEEVRQGLVKAGKVTARDDEDEELDI